MPSDPDNHRMDDALKGFAKKRRDDAGAPFELHPATRQLLQGEVARTYPKPVPGKRSWLRMIAMFWPRLAFATAVFAVLGVVCWISFPSLHSPGPPANLAKNMDSSPAPDRRSVVNDETKSNQEQLDLFPRSRDNTDRPAAPGAAGTGGKLERIDSLSVKLAEQEKLAESDSFKKTLATAAKDTPRRAAASEKALALEPRSRGAADRDADGLVALKQEISPAPAPILTPARRPIAAASRSGSVPDASLPRPELAQYGPADPSAAPRPAPTAPAEPAKRGFTPTFSTEARGNSTPSRNAGGGGVFAGAGLQPASPDTKSAPYEFFAPLATKDDKPIASVNGSTPDLANLPRQLTYVANDPGVSDRYGLDSKPGAPGGSLSLQPAPNLTPRELNRAESFGRSALAENVLLTKANREFGLNPAEAKYQGIAEKPAVQQDALIKANAIQSSSALGVRPAAGVETAARSDLADSVNLRFRRELVEFSENRMTAENAPRYYRAIGVTTDKEDATTGAARNILVSFAFDQNGDSIRIRDADGSIYEGKTVAEVETATLASGLGDVKQVRRQGPAGRNSEPKGLEELSKQKAAMATGRSLHFRVSGTNHNLKQLVVLDGVMTSENRDPGPVRTNGLTANLGYAVGPATTPRLAKDPTDSVRAKSELQPTGAAAAPQAPSEPALVPLSRIRAKARFGATTNEVEINAIRVAR